MCTTLVSKLRTPKLQRSIWNLKSVSVGNLSSIYSPGNSHISHKKRKQGKITFKGNQQMTYGDQNHTFWKFNSPTSSSNCSVCEFPFMSYDGDGLKLLIGIRHNMKSGCNKYTLCIKVGSSLISTSARFNNKQRIFFPQHVIHSWETFSNLNFCASHLAILPLSLTIHPKARKTKSSWSGGEKRKLDFSKGLHFDIY